MPSFRVVEVGQIRRSKWANLDERTHRCEDAGRVGQGFVYRFPQVMQELLSFLISIHVIFVSEHDAQNRITVWLQITVGHEAPNNLAATMFYPQDFDRNESINHQIGKG